MLKDKLNQLVIAPKKRGLCALGSEMAKMDREELDSFVNAMMSQVSSPAIMEVLKEEGITSFGVSHLREKRRQCFVSEEGCACLEEARS